MIKKDLFLAENHVYDEYSQANKNGVTITFGHPVLIVEICYTDNVTMNL